MSEVQVPNIGVFNSKNFNPQVFGKYVDTIPRTKLNKLLTSGVLRPRPEIAAMFPEQTGGNYATVPITGRIGGEPAKFDGVQDMPVSGLDTYSQGMVVTGHMKGWRELDFTQSITGKDFMADIASQISQYWDDFDQRTIISVLTGVFGMTDTLSAPFIASHTTDISAETGSVTINGRPYANNRFNETTLNTAVQKACGDNRAALSIVVMHSFVAMNLENLKLLTWLTNTDPNGMHSSPRFGMLNGLLVLIDDSMPVINGNYTTYVLGNGAIHYANAGVRVPYSMDRNEERHGGIEMLYSRQRKIFAPFGISFEPNAMATLSPALSELEMGVNWKVVQNSGKSQTIDIKAIPIVRIISRG